MCAPNDVWSLGVILVNLTCGRNPWKQASFQDSTYRAYARSHDFLKTILPLSDELNDILGCIFNPIPELRITLPELRSRILACSSFTVPAVAPTVPTSPHPTAATFPSTEYVDEDAIIDDYEYGPPLSPASTSSDDGSFTSSVSTVDDLDDEFVQEQLELSQEYVPHAYEPEEVKESVAAYHTQEFVPQHYTGPVPAMAAPIAPQPLAGQQATAAVQTPLGQATYHQPRSFFPLWEVAKYVQHVPVSPQQGAFHQPVHFMPSFQGCC